MEREDRRKAIHGAEWGTLAVARQPEKTATSRRCWRRIAGVRLVGYDRSNSGGVVCFIVYLSSLDPAQTCHECNDSSSRSNTHPQPLLSLRCPHNDGTKSHASPRLPRTPQSAAHSRPPHPQHVRT
jgi:hypothetical protein